MSRLPDNLRKFVDESAWIFAKTYAKTWPHEYIVRGKVDDNLFMELVKYIKAHGYIGKFYRNEYTYFEDRGKVYWTMEDPVEDTTIINRCNKDQTYEYRLERNDLPK